MHDDRLQAPVVFDAQLQIGPPHDRRAFGPYVDVVEPAVAQRRAGTQILVWGDQPNLTRRCEIRVEHENLGAIDAKLEITAWRSNEPRMPSEARGSRLRVPADLQFELKTFGAQSQRLQSSAAKGPSEAVQLADHRHRCLGPF